MSRTHNINCFRIAALAALPLLAPAFARAAVQGITPTSGAFNLQAKPDRITTPDGNSIYFWGLSDGTARAQYPAPTLIINQNTTTAIIINLTNNLGVAGQNVSLSFPGQVGITATCQTTATVPCVQGPITLEAPPGAQVRYTFIPSRPGTFLYNSASNPELQVEMGIAGAIVVRPTGFQQQGSEVNNNGVLVSAAPSAHLNRRAYGTNNSDANFSGYEQEYLFFLSEMDSVIHDMVEQGGPQGIAAVYASGRLSNYFPNYWFMNGRNAPDTFAPDGAARLPTQPYSALPRTHPGDRVLMRVVGGGHDMHPFHHHGNHAQVIAEDGTQLRTGGSGTLFDLSHMVFTVQSQPGRTADAIFSWTGKDIGWDIYGNNPIAGKGTQASPPSAHGCTAGDDGLDATSREYCADHMKPIPVKLPENLSVANGEFWSGSPFLGVMGTLNPGEGGFNPTNGYTYMWHSHTEKEITNYDIFPGGMMTMLIVEPR